MRALYGKHSAVDDLLLALIRQQSVPVVSDGSLTVVDSDSQSFDYLAIQKDSGRKCSSFYLTCPLGLSLGTSGCFRCAS